MPDKRYSKVEEEIIQILDRMESSPPENPRPNLRVVRSNPPKQRFNVRRHIPHVRAPWLPLAVSIGLAFLALTLRNDSHTAATLLAIGSILALLSPLVLPRVSSGGAGPPQRYGTKTWRGRDISLEPPRGESPAARARRWMDRRNRGNRFR